MNINETIAVLLAVSIFFAIWFTCVNIGLIYRGAAISFINFVIMSLGWTGAVMCVLKLSGLF